MNRADVRPDRWLRHAARLAALTAVAGTATNCIEPLPPFVQGSLEVAVLTTGGDVDLDGYVLSLDGTPLSDIGLNETLLFESMSVGSHSVELTDLADNCVVDGNPKQVAIPDGETLEVSFDVECAATGIWAVITSNGGDAPATYVLTVEGAAALSVQSTSSARVSRLSPGSHTVELTGLGANCHVDGANPVVVTLTAGETIIVSFVVSCGYSTAAIAVTNATSGVSLPSAGYSLLLNGGSVGSLAVNGTRVVAGLVAGSYSLQLSSVPLNCTVNGANPVTATVTTGGMARDTARVAFAVSCAPSGSVAVRTATSGVDVPQQAYGLVVDGLAVDSVAVDGSRVVDDLLAGDHTIELTGVPSNCAVAGANPITVGVATSGQAGDTTDVSFAVSCGYSTAAIAVTNATSGVGLPSAGYDLLLNGGSVGSLAINGARVVAGLVAGSYSLQLSSVPLNCTVNGANPVTATVTTGGMARDTARVAFAVSCAPSGSVAVRTATSGLDAPRRAYGLVIDGLAVDSVAVDGSRVVDKLLAGDHTIELTRVPSNCAVAGANPITVAVATSGQAGDTTDVAFDVVCSVWWGLALTRVASSGFGQAAAIHVAPSHGADAVFFAWGSEPAWSPDGTKIVFAECMWGQDYDYYYGYYWGCHRRGLSWSGTDHTAVISITADALDADPSWRPDGSRIAFANGGGLYSIALDGSGLATVPLPQGVRASEPAWSPDGSTLAFTCELAASDLDICLVRPDGSAFVQLTNAPHREAGPAWKPDGSSIAYTDTRPGSASQIALIAPNGTGRSLLATPMDALRPAWRADGTALGFVGVECNIYSGCFTLGLFRVNADGSGLTQMTSRPDDGLAWRP